MDDGRPIFQQIAEHLEAQILDGTMAEEGQVPSINELAAFFRINPATALRGVNLLVDEGLLYKKRGIGMFVASGARASLLERRRQEFHQDFVQPLAARAQALGLEPNQVEDMLRKEMGA